MAPVVKKIIPYGHVGLSNLANLLYREAYLQGLDLNILVVGESGLGKSTLINNLFDAEIYLHDTTGEPAGTNGTDPHMDEIHDAPSQPSKDKDKRKDKEIIETGETIEIRSTFVQVCESEIELRLNLIDTPGFGDLCDNSVCFDMIEQFITQRLCDYFQWEHSVKKTSEPLKDPRVHLCLYFLPPIGRGLREIDLAFLKRLHRLANIVPVISKCDSLTTDAKLHFKTTLLTELAQNEIRTFNLGGPDFSSQSQDALSRQIAEAMPLAVMGSRTRLPNGHLGREYPWGSVQIDDPRYSDFLLLRRLIAEHGYEITQKTHKVIYENFRGMLLFQRLSNEYKQHNLKFTFNTGDDTAGPNSDSKKSLLQPSSSKHCNIIDNISEEVQMLSILKQDALKELQFIDSQYASLKAMHASLNPPTSATQP